MPMGSIAEQPEPVGRPLVGHSRKAPERMAILGAAGQLLTADQLPAGVRRTGKHHESNGRGT
jgi:hypothetical protein